MHNELSEYLEKLKQLRTAIKTEAVKQIAKTRLRKEAEALGQQWFRDIVPKLESFGINGDTVDRYSANATKLIRLSSPNNLKSSYLRVLKALTKPFRDELVLPIQTSPGSGGTGHLSEVLGTLPDEKENDYLQEAVSCAKAKFYRASAILGWCATIDRIHRVIDHIGATKFNVTSSQMASQQKGRFRRFNKSLQVSNLSDLRQVFDTDVLWVLEGLELIDLNEHTRLRGCFDMRCQCAHPGNAPITVYNLMSFFSDIKKIILVNPKFEIPE